MTGVEDLVLHSDLSQEHANTPLAPLKTRKIPPPSPLLPQRKREGGMGGCLPAKRNVSHHIVRSIFQSCALLKSTEIRATAIRAQMITGVSTGISR